MAYKHDTQRSCLHLKQTPPAPAVKELGGLHVTQMLKLPGLHVAQGCRQLIQALPVKELGGLQLKQVVAVPLQVAQGGVQGVQIPEELRKKPS